MAEQVVELRIGWAQGDITPKRPVLISGQFHARVSEGVRDPITVTALALHRGEDHAVLVSCDVVGVPEALRDAVRALLGERSLGLDTRKVVLNATHTHTGPELRFDRKGGATASAAQVGVDLPVMSVEQYQQFTARVIADVVAQAWQSLGPGAVSFGLGQAVVGRNRRWTDINGRSKMYGDTNTPAFSHIEGYEDHSVNVLATHDPRGELTGLVVNVPCTSQVNEGDFVLSADFWAQTRAELRRRFGAQVFVLPQCSAAGDQSPHLLFEKRAAQRMLKLKGRDECQEIAVRLADAVGEVLECTAGTRDPQPVLRHHVETLELPLARLTEADVANAQAEAQKLRETYEQENRKLEADPKLREKPRWYCDATAAYRRMRWFEGVAERYEAQQKGATFPAEVHVIRLGDMAIATNPFELYLDFGIHIKARSKAVQTFLVQLAGPGSYVPSARSMAGGGYGSIPASNPVDATGGWQLAHRTVEILDGLWR